MKSEGKVRHQLAQVIFRHRKKMVAAGLAPTAPNCAHNRHLALYGKVMGICGLNEGTPSWNRVACDQNLCPEVARTCPFFTPARPPAELKVLFQQQLENLLSQAQQGQPGYLAHQYPDVAALLWVLEDDPKAVSTLQLLQEDHDPDVAPSPPHAQTGDDSDGTAPDGGSG